MSLSWRKHVRVGLCPDRLVLAAYRGGLRRALPGSMSAGEIVALDAESGAARWEAAVNALPSALAAWSPGKPRATVILSNHFVRYAVLPWNDALKSEDEWLAYARHRLESVHGHAAAEWNLRVAGTAAQGARVVCAVDQALLDAVDARVAQSGAELVSVQPYLMAAFNRMRERLDADRCWLVIEEPDRLTIALIQDGAWSSIRCRRVEGDWRRGLTEILERESATLALEARCNEVVIHAPEPFDIPLSGDYRVRDLTLPGSAPASRQPLAMALQ